MIKGRCLQPRTSSTSARVAPFAKPAQPLHNCLGRSTGRFGARQDGAEVSRLKETIRKLRAGEKLEEDDDGDGT